jgi:hypothetical protein
VPAPYESAYHHEYQENKAVDEEIQSVPPGKESKFLYELQTVTKNLSTNMKKWHWLQLSRYQVLV